MVQDDSASALPFHLTEQDATMNTKVLVIDDLRSFPFECDYARTSKEGIGVLSGISELDELWLDHDLGIVTGEPSEPAFIDDIWPVIDHLVERAHSGPPLNVARIYIHTMNPSSAGTMHLVLAKWYPSVVITSATGHGATI